MYLVELLARELDVWPEGADWVVQEGDKELYCAWDDKPFWSGGASWRDGENGDGRYFESQEPTVLADDWKTAIITRADWQAERERIAGGWIAHDGGECPVAEGVDVDYMMRGGVENTDGDGVTSERLRWDHRGTSGDIIAYRLHKPEQASAEAIDVGIAVADAGQVKPIGEVKAMYEYNPIHTRNRILEIDRTTEALEEERAQLVQRLADEGFVLARVDGKVVAAQPADDMVDHYKWMIGDIIQSVTDEDDDIRIGGKYALYDLCSGGSVYLIDAAGDRRYREASDYKFHSRPTA